ncbi:nitrate- and nitrite sensing domain-containing protein [Streptomyces sp. 891-h]|uniref:sensor histidine kinase n=1 Tax=Streptomyces sp. 891-h TaxID=2720714 RepID=UPI001FAAE58F|nr:nitrate- and nitrite sensing domain-containing protein [Streptomyces sp. 891-h]UNZ17326.1 HAMP domain-containing protein [Streptomyces sp. 891-h]
MSVAVGAVAVVAAGAPTLVAGSQDAADAQDLVDLARLDQQAIALSHSLADERDGMVEHLAAGRSGKGGTGVTETQRDRVDRRVRELRVAASSAPSGSAAPSASPATVVEALKKLPAVRKRAMAGKGGPVDAYESYSALIKTLRQLTRGIADGLPARAENRTAAALPDLARAVDQASATRGLLEAALAGQGTQRSLVTAAGQARVREQAALADFEETADTKARETYNTTVNGADVNVAERYLKVVTAQNRLTPAARAVDRERFDSSVSARLAHMRGVQSSFAAAEIKRLEGLRDDDVTALQLRAGLVGGCLLLAVAVSVATARSLTRPLSVLKRGSKRIAQDPAAEEPITFKGRNDEFADVVRALNTLRTTAADLKRRSACAEREQDELAVEKAKLTEKHQLLGEEFAALRTELETAREQLAARQPHGSTRDKSAVVADDTRVGETARAAGPAADHSTFADLGTRTLTLVEQQLGIIEGLEEKEADPDRLETLFKLDHLATRMRRHSENLLLLTGTERGERSAVPEAAGPAPLLDVLRAAVSEIAQYERVELGTLPPDVRVSGPAADDLSHLVAELLDNAAAFSATESAVLLSARTRATGEAVVSVEDEGEGIAESRLAELNTWLAEPLTLTTAQETAQEAGESWGLGMYVVARLSARHGIRVRLRAREGGGTVADVTVPGALMVDNGAPEDEHAPLGDEHAPEGDEHTRAEDQAPAPIPAPTAAPIPEQRTGDGPAQSAESAPSAEPAEPQGSAVHPGLPQRVRRETAHEPSAPRPRKGGATAEELRRKLDGFQQGTKKGLRDAGVPDAGLSESGARPDTGVTAAASAPSSAAEAEEPQQDQHSKQAQHEQHKQHEKQQRAARQTGQAARDEQTEDTGNAEDRAGAQVDGGTAEEARK